MAVLYRSRIYRALAPGFLRLFGPVHIALYRALGGRGVDRLAQGFMPVLLLTTTGRRSGRKRTQPVGYVREGDTLLLVGSNGALPHDPGWLFNLQDGPEAEVQLRAARHRVRAEVLEGAERQRAWELVARRHPFFATYQRATLRRIPVVRLSVQAPLGGG